MKKIKVYNELIQKWEDIAAGETGSVGPQGPAGPQGPVGPQGEKGDTGASPIVTVTETDTGAIISIISNNEETFAEVFNGEPGPQGEQGLPGESGVYVGAVQPESPNINVWINPNGGSAVLRVRNTQGNWDIISSIQGEPGEPGSQGPQGDPGNAGVYVGLEEPGDDINVWIIPSESSTDVLKIRGTGGQWETIPSIQGAQGEIGPAGPAGPQGDPGVFIGTAEPFGANLVWINTSADPAVLSIKDAQGEWIEIPAIQGMQGEIGPQGPEGPQGPAGPQGEPGKVGPIGLQGEKGDSPVRGVDYWTVEDQNAIVAEVLALLPTAESESV